MNPFAIQAEFARQWVEFAGAMTKAALDAYSAAGQQAASAMTAMVPTPSAPRVEPLAPWMAFWPKPALPAPFGAFAAFNPFAAFAQPASPPALPFMPWTQFLPGFAQPAAMSPFAGMAAMPWAWPMQVASAAMAPFAAAMASRSPNATLMDQMAANYRSSSGYAVAAVISPLANPMDARSFTAPWWQLFSPNRAVN